MSTLDNLRKEAKHWLKEVRRNNPGPVKRLRLAYPSAPANPGLRDIQHALARERGYESWKALKVGLSSAAKDAMPDARDSHAARVAQFLRCACWDHTISGHVENSMAESAALRLLRKHPEIARANLYTAVVCGDLDEAARLLAADPGLANRKGGVKGWEPILYLCYGRVAVDAVRDNVVAIARLLLDHGADPNAYFPAGDATYSTLVGIAGEGEQDASPHPQREPLYELLLERGAEPYDIQVLYNTNFHGDVLWWLELTYQHSVRTGHTSDWDNPDWPMLDMGGYGSGARFLLSMAIDKNDPVLAEWLLTHGANPNAGPARDARFPQRSLYEDAAFKGRNEIARRLLNHGASPTALVLNDEEAFIAACARLDRGAIEIALNSHPEYLTSSALFHAAQQNRADVVAMLLDFGTSVDLEDAHGRRALHVAAQSGAHAVASLLIERGAQVDPRERYWKATPIGFATYHGHQLIVDLLSPVSRDVWALAYHGKIDRLREVLASEPERAREVLPGGITPLWRLPNDETLAAHVVDLLLAHGADPTITSKDGTTPEQRARERGLDQAADRLAALRH